MAEIDLSALPSPAVVEALDYEVIVAQLSADYQARLAALSAAAEAPLESDPAYKVIESGSYRETLVRARINDAALAVQLPTARGDDLTRLAALFGVARQVVTPADPTAIPPTAAVYESDARLRERTQLAPEGYSVAGPAQGYRSHALSADTDVLDAAFDSPSPAVAVVTILSREEGQNGVPTTALLNTVRAALSDENVRPAGDRLTVQGATIVEFSVNAQLAIEQGPDAAVVRAAARAALDAYLASAYRIGQTVRRSLLIAALAVPNVRDVTLNTPAADVAVTATEAARATSITIQ